MDRPRFPKAVQLQRFGSKYPDETRLLIHYFRGVDKSLKAKIADIVFPTD